MSATRQDNDDAIVDQGELLSQGELVAVDDIRDALVIKEGGLFFMSDSEGNAPLNNLSGFGLYKDDTRYLSTFNLTFGGTKPTVLLSTAELGFSSEHHLTNPTMVMGAGDADLRTVPKESLEVRRQRLVNASLIETIQITNHNAFRVIVPLRLDFAADFADIFEVRGERRRQRGKLSEPEFVSQGQVDLAYVGLDGVRRKASIKLTPPPDYYEDGSARFVVPLEKGDTATIAITVSLDDRDAGDFAAEFDSLSVSYRRWYESCTQIVTSNEFFNAILGRSLSDVRMLEVKDGSGGGYVAAGTPWFSTLFGRDSLINSLQLLAFNPDVARRTLEVLARWQGARADDWRDERPGKILHELRTGEMASLDEIPMGHYYGSVDATPLFLMLAAEYVAWTNDLEVARRLEPSLAAAMGWIDEHLRESTGGFLEYARRSSRGLVNQGWKDSHDGVVNGDGTLVRPPIALSEVQAYVYAAKRGLARLYSLLGKDREARRLRREASDLSDRFNRDFWLEDERYFAIALGAEGQPATSITSNPAHGLWTGIVQGDKVPAVVDRLFRNDMFSGWGIRTLSSGAARYNPLGYHLGSVWPHDNAIIGMGLKRAGFEDYLNELATALYDCCRNFDYYRLPELFCGIPRTPHGMPVRYPVACRPQAWAAGAFPMLLHAILGLVPNAPANELRVVSPRLPHWLDEVEVRGLRVGDSAVDLLFEKRRGRTCVSVPARRGVNVILARRRR